MDAATTAAATREAAAQAQPVQQTLTQSQLQPVVQQALAGLSNALPIGVLGQGSGAVLGGVQAQPATSAIPAPQASTPSASAAGSSQAVPLGTPPGQALEVPAYHLGDQTFADLEGTQSVALTPTAGQRGPGEAAPSV